MHVRPIYSMLKLYQYRSRGQLLPAVPVARFCYSLYLLIEFVKLCQTLYMYATKLVVGEFQCMISFEHSHGAMSHVKPDQLVRF